MEIRLLTLGKSVIDWPAMSIAENPSIEFEEDIKEDLPIQSVDLEKRPTEEGTTARTSPRTLSANLVIQYRNTGNSELFGQLCELYRAMLSHYLLQHGVKDDHEREDLLQDVYFQAQRKIDALREPAAFGSWIRTIARRMNINKGQRHRAPLAMDHDTLEAFSHMDSVPEANILALQQERKDRIHKAIRRMKPLDRKMLNQHYFEGLELKEMAAINKAPMGTIKRRLHTARQRLGVLLADADIIDAKF